MIMKILTFPYRAVKWSVKALVFTSTFGLWNTFHTRPYKLWNRYKMVEVTVRIPDAFRKTKANQKAIKKDLKRWKKFLLRHNKTPEGYPDEGMQSLRDDAERQVTRMSNFSSSDIWDGDINSHTLLLVKADADLEGFSAKLEKRFKFMKVHKISERSSTIRFFLGITDMTALSRKMVRVIDHLYLSPIVPACSSANKSLWFGCDSVHYNKDGECLSCGDSLPVAPSKKYQKTRLFAMDTALDYLNGLDISFIYTDLAEFMKVRGEDEWSDYDDDLESDMLDIANNLITGNIIDINTIDDEVTEKILRSLSAWTDLDKDEDDDWDEDEDEEDEDDEEDEPCLQVFVDEMATREVNS